MTGPDGRVELRRWTRVRIRPANAAFAEELDEAHATTLALAETHLPGSLGDYFAPSERVIRAKVLRGDPLTRRELSLIRPDDWSWALERREAPR